MQYLRGTADACLFFEKTRNEVIDFVNSYFVGDLDKRRSLTRYVFTFNGYVTSWKAIL